MLLKMIEAPVSKYRRFRYGFYVHKDKYDNDYNCSLIIYTEDNADNVGIME